ncbi:MAG: amidohydrolase family protein [Bacteroidales bacterium]
MRKIAAHYIFDGLNLIKNGMLTLTDEGEIVSVSEFNPNKELANLEFINGILCPGFVNAHCHLELSYLKGKFSDNGGLKSFIEQMKEIDRTETPEKVEQASLADKELLDEGIVACGDIVNSTLTLEVKKKSKIFYHNFIELFSLDESLSESVFQKGLALYNKFAGYSRSITYHAPYSVSYSLFKKISKHNKLSHDICSIHVFETKDEETLIKQWQTGNWQWNKSCSQTIIEQIPFENQVLFVHNTFIDDASFNFICEKFKHRAWVLCPTSNMFIENTLPPLHLLLRDKDNICIGTDSYASNYQLSILNELKILSTYFPEIEMIDWLKMATFQGAKALNIQDKFGSFKIGTKPGVLALMGLDLPKLKLTDRTYVKRII